MICKKLLYWTFCFFGNYKKKFLQQNIATHQRKTEKCKGKTNAKVSTGKHTKESKHQSCTINSK